MKRARSFRSLLLLASLSMLPAQSQIIFHSQPPEARAFASMAWDGVPSERDQLRLMQEAGLNIAGFCSAQEAMRVHSHRMV